MRKANTFYASASLALFLLICLSHGAALPKINAAISTGFLRTQGNSQCVDLKSGQAVNGQALLTAQCNAASVTQQWQFKQASTANKQLLATANNMCLDVKDGKSGNGVPVQAWSCSPGNKNQFWSQSGSLIRWNGGSYCLDIANGVGLGFASQLPLQIWTCDASNKNQVFSFTSTLSTSAPATSTPTSIPASTSTSTTATSATSKAVFDPSRKRMLAWGYDDRAAPQLGKGLVGSYHRWESNVVLQMPSAVMFVPTYWGTSKKANWQTVKATLGNTVPAAVMGFNEPDIASQANMDPVAAATEYYNEITRVYGVKGSMMISPSVVWNVDGWLAPFMTQCARLGCGIDAMGYHIYLDLQKEGKGSVDNLMKLIDQRITYLYNRFKKPIVLGELGLTQAGGGTDAQMAEFMHKSAAYLDRSPYVLAWALSAVFRKGQGWDGYLNSNMAFFDANGNLSQLGKDYTDTVY
jgi:hypothetical protein